MSIRRTKNSEFEDWLLKQIELIIYPVRGRDEYDVTYYFKSLEGKKKLGNIRLDGLEIAKMRGWLTERL